MNRDPINAALDADANFRRHWKAFRPKWRTETPADERNLGILRHRAIELGEAGIDAGIHNPQKLTEHICGGLETIVIGIVVRLLVEALARALLKRRGLLKPDRAGGKGKRR